MDWAAWWATVHGAAKELEMTERLSLHTYIIFITLKSSKEVTLLCEKYVLSQVLVRVIWDNSDNISNIPYSSFQFT